MSRRRPAFVRIARAMIADTAILSGLVIGIVGDAYLWRDSGDWLRPVRFLVFQMGTAAAFAIAAESHMPSGEKRSCTDVERGTTGPDGEPAPATELGCAR